MKFQSQSDSIDFDTNRGSKKVKDMSPEERRQWLSEIGKKGGEARAKAFTRAYQMAARRKLSPEKAAENGRKGAARTIELYGHETLFQASRRKRLHNPSPCELVMIGLLKQMGLKNEREYRLGTSLYTLDFFLGKHRLGIEVDGTIHDAGKPEEFKRRDWAARKRVLCAHLGITLLTIHHTELGEDLTPVIARVRAAMFQSQSDSIDFDGNRGSKKVKGP